MALAVIDYRADGLAVHSLAPPKGLVPADRVLDIGCGIRPVSWGSPRLHACVDPHKPYCELLAAAGYPVQVGTACEFLSTLRPGLYDAIYMLDVIEHMDRADGKICLDLAVMAQPKQVVVFTPRGFVEQVADAWNMGGEYWQRHRSGWTPADFGVDWRIEERGDSFFAVWTNGNDRILAG